MITSAEIKKKASRKYSEYLRNIAVGIEFQPFEILCDKELEDIRSFSKEVKGYGYTIEWKIVKHKMLGTQDLPSKIMFETASDFERFLQKSREVINFRNDIAQIKKNSLS